MEWSTTQGLSNSWTTVTIPLALNQKIWSVILNDIGLHNESGIHVQNLTASTFQCCLRGVNGSNIGGSCLYILIGN